MLPAVERSRDSLPRSLVATVHELNGSDPKSFTLTLATAWVVIVGAIVTAESIGAWWASVLAILIVATRMNVLGLLVHDQVHMLGYRGRFGDLIVNVFCAYPLLLLTVQGYARVHLAHHRDYFTPRDPDHVRKSGKDWTFPKPPAELMLIAIRDLLGLNLISLIRGKNAEQGLERFARRSVDPAWARPLFALAVIVIVTLTGSWRIATIYWFLPIATIMQLIVRWGAICEHEYNHEGGDVRETTPLIELRWWERLLLPNLNFSLHIYHHYFPGVPFSRLPEVHRLFCEAGFVNRTAVFHGYWAYLRHLTGSPVEAGASPTRG
jgi:fatty acid desaturase